MAGDAGDNAVQSPPVAVAVAAEPPLEQPPAVPQRKRKRLAKAFARPLDEQLKGKRGKKKAPDGADKSGDAAIETVRDGFTFLRLEHAKLVNLKKQLVRQGVSVKKSELIRAGLYLVAELPADQLQALLARLPPTD